MSTHVSQTISGDDHDIRLDRWFKRHYPGLQHAMLEKFLRKGDVRIDGKKAKSSDRIVAGQTLTHPDLSTANLPAKAPKALVNERDAQMMQKLVLYKDANVIVINKPFGLPVQGGTKISKSIDDMLGALQFDAKERPKLVHRLDRDTSGCLVLARNTKTASMLGKAFAGKDIEKTYWALVHNVPLPPQGTVDYKLVKALHHDAKERMEVDEEDGKYAKTEYKVLEFLARRFALMELKPLTGRTHQLRVHMMAIGCPIVGDNKYGGETIAAKHLGVENMLHLHSRRVVIPAFGSGKKIDVSAPLPEHMKHSFEALGIETKK